MNDSFLLHGVAFCGECVEDARISIGANAADIQRGVDPTICTACGKDSLEGEWSASDGVPICEACAANMKVAALPWWLTNSMIALTILLMFALVHGSGYIRAVRNTYRAEARIARGENAQAVELLAPVVDKYPSCERCVLNLAIAYLGVGNASESWKVTKAHGTFSDDVKDLSDQLQRGFDKVDEAGTRLDEADDLMDKDRPNEARAKVDEAKRVYPQWDIYPYYDEAIKATDAFVRRDWDAFLLIRKEELDRNPDSPFALASYASALSAKYAATGDESFKKAAITKLDETRARAKGDKKAEEMVAEFSPRIEHRIKSREIISKSEYDRRFRPELVAKNEVKK